MTNEERRAEDLRIRKDFPLIDGHPEIAYLDNSATTQKPESVLRAMQHYYLEENANPLRGLYELSVKATEAYEDAREAVRAFIGAGSIQEIIFTRNASESLNLVAYSAGEAFLNEGDEILITIMEHHSNLIPWQQAAARRGAVLKFLEPDEEGYISEENFSSMLSPKTKLVSMTHISNVLGVKNDVKTFARIAHENGRLFILGGAQSLPHIPVDVTELDVDFLAFSGHKMLAPMGIGVLYGKKELLEKILFEFLKKKSQSQLLVTTHNDGLLDLLDDLIRKDSVWFTEKQKTGVTDLYKLTDFRGLNRLSSIREAYRNKRFGATMG